MDACPAVFKRGGYNFRLPPLKVRDLRLDLGKNISFSDTLLDEKAGIVEMANVLLYKEQATQ